MRNMDAIEILEKKLVGNLYSRFSVGDTFDYYFNGFWLIAQNVVSPDEEHINKMISNYHPAQQAIDKQDMVKSLISCCTLRKAITDLLLGDDATLILTFENDVNLHFATDTEHVDWHWAINEKGNDPYLECMVGCFSPGEIQISNR